MHKNAKIAILESIIYSIIATVAVAIIFFLIRNHWDISTAAKDMKDTIMNFLPSGK